MKQSGIEAQRKAQTRTIQQHQPPDPLGLLQGDLHGDPSTHGPTCQVHLLQVLAIQEALDYRCLLGDGIVGIPGLCGTSVSQQIQGIDAMAAGDEPRYQVGPVGGPAAQPVHQHQRPAGATDQVMHFVAIDGDKFAVHTVQAQPGVDLLVDQPQRIAPSQMPNPSPTSSRTNPKTRPTLRVEPALAFSATLICFLT